MHLSEIQGRWFPKGPKKHTTKRKQPYATQPSPPPPAPQNPKPKHGNSGEVHAKKISWDKCSRKGCKAHKEEKRRNGTVRTRLGREGDTKLQEWGRGEETEIDDEGTLQGPTCFNNDTSYGRQYEYKMRRLRSNKKRSSNNELLSKLA